MFTESAAFYDLVYSFKDYQKEAEEITAIIKAKKPDCKTILDIGCGTAEHHKYLKNAFQIDGLDINGDFIQSAKAKNQSGTYHLADMTDFNLNKKYDIITCLFSSIGYVKTFENLTSALKCFNTHLHDNGLAIVEPWLTPDNWYKGKLHMLTYDKDDIKICRMNLSESEGNLSIINFHYLLGTLDKGVSHFEERHELALFSKEEMKNAFKAANFEVTHDEHGLIGRGMYYGIKKNAV
ncbi:MAG: class I SAM-dependent methyltransferase [Saprospiraceae bacterium]|nr:class I SAM-dependent methyltransferase [Saprospiraceae bacterium]